MRRMFAAVALLAVTACGGPAQHAQPSAPGSVTPTQNPGGLSDAQMVGQLFYGFAYGSGPSAATPVQRRINTEKYAVGTPAEIVARWHLGGVILIDRNTLDPHWGLVPSGNVDSASATRRLTDGLQAAAAADSGVRLLIGTDQEGGTVQRVSHGVDARPAQADIAHRDPAVLRCDYFRLGTQLRELGINQNFAPDADVLRVKSTVIGSRSFGSDPALVALDVEAAAEGLGAAGVLPTLKHWPGHGGVSADSHETLPVLRQTRADWAAVDRLPFESADRTGAAVMVGHLAFPAVDPSGRPATLSKPMIAGELRGRLGFDGLVLTDSLEMRPVADRATPAQIAVLAIASGADMLLMSPDVPGASKALLAKVRADPEFRATVRTAVQRILAAKATIEPDPSPPSGC